MSGPNGSSARKSRSASLATPPPETSPRAVDPVGGLNEILLHGHRVFYRSAGSGPVVVLVHGITSTSSTWANLMPYLAERCSATGNRPSHGVTTRSARTPAASAT